jgi:hypothetical protein
MDRQVSKVQPSINDRATFLMEGQKVTGKVSAIVFGESFTATAEDGTTIYSVKNEEVLRLVGGNGVYAKNSEGNYNYSQFCTFARKQRPRWRTRR